MPDDTEWIDIFGNYTLEKVRVSWIAIAFNRLAFDDGTISNLFFGLVKKIYRKCVYSVCNMFD